MNGALPLLLCGEQLLLHPERALSWPAQRLLVVGDTHFGKSSVFGRHGLAVPDGADALDRERIAALLKATGSERLLILGDFLHGWLDPAARAALELQRWIDGLHPVRLWLVVGNHDRSAATGWQASADWQGDSLQEGPFRFTHDVDGPGNPADGFRIGGHVHPVVALGSARKRRLRVPVFWQRDHSLVLPSFGLFTGGYRIRPSDGGQVYAAGPDEVVALPWQR